MATKHLQKQTQNHELDEFHKDVPGNYYHEALRSNLLQKFWHTRRFKEISSLVKSIEAERILDAGCHGGRFTYEISKHFKKSKIFGIDISPDAISFAKKKYKTINFRVAKVEKLPFKDSQFDLVLCLEVMEHLPDPNQAIKEMKRVLKRNGKIVILVPVENYLFRTIWFLWVKFGAGRIWKHTHVQKFDSQSLTKFLIKNNFKIERTKKFMFGMLLATHAKKS